MNELCESLLFIEQMETNSAVNTTERRNGWGKAGLHLISGNCNLSYK